MIFDNLAITVTKDLHSPPALDMERIPTGWLFVYRCECGREFITANAIYDEAALCVCCREQ